MDSRNGIRTDIVGLHNRGALMAKKPSDFVYEVRFSLQDKEREMADSLIAILGLQTVPKMLDGLGVEHIAKMMDDPTRIVQVMYSVALILEAFGIETGWPTPFDYADWRAAYDAKKDFHAQTRAETGATGPAAGQTGLDLLTGIVYNLLNPNWSWFEPPPQEP